MNMHNLTFPAVAKYHEPGNDVGTTFIIYNPTSAIVIDHEPSSPYVVGQVIEGRIGFRNTENVTFESACTLFPPKRVLYIFLIFVTSSKAINGAPFF